MRNFSFPGRSPVHSMHGMAATSHPAATQAALETLREGGGAVDAAICAAAVLAVVEPTETGIGGDCFALYAPARGAVVGLNGSGWAPARAKVEDYLSQGIDRFAIDSPHTVTVPGAIAAWFRLHGDYGKLPWSRVLAPAIDFAAHGCPVHSRIAWDWARAAGRLASDPGASRVFLPGGRTPRVGEVHAQPQLAETLRTVAREGARGFYKGPVANAIVTTLKYRGGLHEPEDFAEHDAEYVQPISARYRGLDIYQCPPNGRGIAVLLMLRLLEGFDIAADEPLSPARMHLLGEATRLAFGVVDRYIGDPRFCDVPVDTLLSDEYIDTLRAQVQRSRSQGPIQHSSPMHPDTVYLSVVDSDRNAVSFINSLFFTFGSGIFCPETGVLLQNRGLGFVLEAGHPNCIAPHKRPLHTILPGIARQNGETLLSYAVMGGQYQPVGQTQVVTNLVDYRMDVQEALDFPRSFYAGEKFQLEHSVPTSVAEGLKALGHEVAYVEAPWGGGADHTYRSDEPCIDGRFRSAQGWLRTRILGRNTLIRTACFDDIVPARRQPVSSFAPIFFLLACGATAIMRDGTAIVLQLPSDAVGQGLLCDNILVIGKLECCRGKGRTHQ